MFFRRSKTAMQTPPSGLGRQDIQKQSSICTGETLIGFKDPHSGRLLEAVVVRSAKEEADFYRSYGYEPPLGL